MLRCIVSRLRCSVYLHPDLQFASGHGDPCVCPPLVPIQAWLKEVGLKKRSPRNCCDVGGFGKALHVIPSDEFSSMQEVDVSNSNENPQVAANDVRTSCKPRHSETSNTTCFIKP